MCATNVIISWCVLNIGLCVSMFVSFMCKLFLLILYMWYFSNMFRLFPLFYFLIMSIVSVMVPYVC
jgi:hypothetical protein